MDKALQDELNVDPWTPGPSASFSTTMTRAAGKTKGTPKVAKCPTCNDPIIMAVTRESGVSVGVCEKCRRRWAPSVLEAQS